jgi:AcrR family transcriptional regulator
MSKTELNTVTESRILEAAEKVFYLKGKDGTSMQDIADEAKLTRTSLNYYYRSKDKLFDIVFRNTMGHFLPKVADLLNSERSLIDLLPELVELVIDSMLEKPQIPVFVLQELSSNPERLPQIWADLGIQPAETLRKMKNDALLAELPVDPRQLIINVISMCIFPFAAKPLLLELMYEHDEQAYITAMEERKELIQLMIKNMLKSS